MRRRALLRTLAMGGVIGAGIEAGASTTDLVQPVQAQAGSGLYQEAKLTAADGENNDKFGKFISVSSDGKTALIGADKLDQYGIDGNRLGAVYVFKKQDGSWSQQAKLTPNDGEAGGSFGDSVALSGDGTTALIGAHTDDQRAGSVHVFTDESGSWNQQTKLTVTDNASYGTYGRLGYSVDLSSDGATALIGTNGGAAYVFNKDSGTWGQQAELINQDISQFDKFGTSVAISGDSTTALIGSWGDTDPSSTDEPVGSAYIFSNQEGSWSQETKLTADAPDEGDQFGSQVAISNGGTTAIIGDPADDYTYGNGVGSAYIFKKNNNSWRQQAKFTADNSSNADRLDSFADTVASASDGTIAIMGAPRDDNPNGRDAGAAFIFRNQSDAWNQQTKLITEDGDENDGFGHAAGLSIDGTTAVIGAPNDEDPNGEGAGSVYIFSQQVHIETPSLEPPNVEGEQSTHTLSFDAKNVSADGSGEEFSDEFKVNFPENVVLKGYSNVDIEAQFSNVEQNGNTLTFSVSPSGGGTTQVSVEMDVTLAPANNQ